MDPKELEAARERARAAMGRTPEVEKKAGTPAAGEPADLEKRRRDAYLAMEGEERKAGRVKKETEEKEIASMRQRVDDQVKKLKEQEAARQQEEEAAKIKAAEAEERKSQEKLQQIEESKKLLEELRRGAGNNIELLRTFDEDAAAAIQNKTAETGDMVSVGGETADRRRTPARNIWKPVLSFILLVLAMIALGFGLWYWQNGNRNAKTEAVRPPAIIPYNELAELDLDATSGKDLAGWLAVYLQNNPGPKTDKGSVVYLYAIRNESLDPREPSKLTKVPADLPYLIERLSLPIEKRLANDFDAKNFIFGLKRTAETADLFLIVKTEDYERTIGSLLAGEKTLAGLFDTLSGATAATATPVFSDRLVNNIPIRSAAEADRDGLTYGFIDSSRTLLLLTGNERTFGALVKDYLAPRLPAAN